MPKYDQYQRTTAPLKEKTKIHPVWRGIGCVMMVVIPVLSFLTANYLIKSRDVLTWVLIPQDLVFKQLKDPLFWVTVFYAVVIALALFLIMGVITFIIDKFLGPPKKGPYDVR